MAATAEIGLLKQNTLPVCLVTENPNRLVSLWDIVNQFRLIRFGVWIAHLEGCEVRMEELRSSQGQDARVDDSALQWIRNVLNYLHEACAEIKLKDSANQIFSSICHLNGANAPKNAEVLWTRIRNIRETIIHELGNRNFLWIANDLNNFVDQEALFGGSVTLAFPSAATDIKEAGNCLAAECSTASVFHLMRAAEVALRALARDRAIAFSDKPLEQKEWGQILSKLGSVTETMRQESSAKWQSTDAREIQIRFYGELVQELRAFNEVWRRHVSHADQLAFYDRDQAISIFNHVKLFMQKLATKISENTNTPMYWEK